MINNKDTTFYNLPFKLDYKYIKTVEEAFRSFSYFDNFNIIGIDTETTGLDPFNDHVVLLQMALPNGKVFVYDLRYINGELFRPILEDNRILHVIQNGIFDYKILKTNYNISINRIYDTMLAERCINLGLHLPANLKHLVYKYLNYNIEKDVATDFCDSKLGELTNRQIQYAAHDAMCLLNIAKAQNETITSNKLNDVCKLEFQFMPCLADMELAGVLIDVNKWKSIIEKVKTKLKVLTKDILPALSDGVPQLGLFGSPAINLSSNAQLLNCLNNLGLQLSDTSVASLKMVKDVHEAIPMLLEYRKLEKLLNSFGETILEKINPKTGRLHSTYNQLVSTGRLSCSSPNLQQIPADVAFRSCFIASPGYKLITSDMSQAELRILACYSKDPVFINTYLQGKDLHVATACGVFNLTEEEVIADNNLPNDDPNKKNYRKRTKAINFGICVSQTTNVITNKGIKEIRDCNINDIVAHDIGKDKIIDKQYKGEKEVFEIKTKYGYTLEVTKNHLIKVINADGNYVDKALEDIDINVDQACLKAGANLFADKLYVFGKFSIKKISNYKHLDLPKTLDENWAAFLGLFVAEGSAPIRKGKNYSWLVQFSFSKKEPEILDNVYKLLSLLFKDRLSVYSNYKNKITYKISSSLLAAWVRSLFNLGRNKTNTIHIPNCIKRSPKNVQISFIRWMLEGDGSIAYNHNGVRIRYASTSYMLVKDLQLLLLNMNIISSITYHYDKRSPGEKFYDLSIVSDNSRRLFMKQIGFVTSYKNNRCQSKISHSQPFYNINNQNNRLKNIKHNKAIKYLSHDIELNHVNNTHLKIFSRYNNFFKFIYDNNIITLPIVSIKSKGIKPVYDISVENRELFLANGFIVHNCYGMSAYGLAERLDISKEEAEDFINKYFKTYPRVKAYLDKSANLAIRRGYSTTISGRRRYYKMPSTDIPVEERKKIFEAIGRRAKNASIQGCLCYNTNVFGAGMIGENVGKIRILTAGKNGSIRAIGKYSGKQKVYKLTTNMGFTLIGTYKHPITVKNGKHDIMVPLGESVNMSARMVSMKYRGFPINIKNIIKKYKIITKNNYITSELGFILGCLYDSGYFESKQELFYIDNKIITQKLIKSCYRYFKLADNINKYAPIKFINKNSKIFISFNKNIKNLLYDLLYDNNGESSYLSCILNSPIEIREAFVSGILGCKSRIDKNKQKITILCSNNRVAFTIQQLLLSINIISFRENNENGCCQLKILDDFIGNAVKLINDYNIGLNLYTSMPNLEFYDIIKSVEKYGVKDTYDFVSNEEPHMYIANGFKVSNSNADVLKQSFINMSNNIKKEGYDAKIILTVHDEMVVEAKEDQAENVAKTLTKSITDAWSHFFTDIPMVSDSVISSVWEH